MRAVPGLLAALLALLLAGCAELEKLAEQTRAHITMVEGLRQFDAGQHAEAAKTLASALEMGLDAKDRATAHKHLAFIQCTAGREGACREQFRKALAADPALRLDAAEAGHPVWGPVFRSLSGPGMLGAGLKQYEEGAYDESARSLQGAIDLGLPDKQRAVAHKYLAFIHCTGGRESRCRDEFRNALAADPGMRLDAAEAGHPLWGPVFRSLSGPGSLSIGLKQYEEGDYEQSAKNLQGAIALGVPDKQRATAHKHLAFIHCSSNRVGQCRDEFRKALAVDPQLELAPAEAGHPVWGPIFRSLKSGR
jgi:Tfp pilus assembly protein PilF